jgi:hypothetical protein
MMPAASRPPLGWLMAYRCGVASAPTVLRIGSAMRSTRTYHPPHKSHREGGNEHIGRGR